MKGSTAARVSVVAVLLLPAAARAADRWESGSIPLYSDDDTAGSTRNELRHGDFQVGHDLQGTPSAPDRDFYIVRTQIHHTYEALVRSGTLFWGTGTAFCVPPGGTSVCPRFDLVLADGTLIREGVADGASNHPSVTSALRLRLFGTSGTSYLRVTGDTGGSTHTAADQYDIVFRDTTYTVPRFNNTASQFTVLMVQNPTDRVVSVAVQLFDEAGALLTTYGSNIAPRGLLVQPLAAAPAAQGKSGSALITHDGPYGALAGKVVALEPATGFTFDTAIAPIPY